MIQVWGELEGAGVHSEPDFVSAVMGPPDDEDWDESDCDED
jgi:hypothetical protein